MNKIAILMPHYRHKVYVIRAIESILNQTFGNFDLFILNDDDTAREMLADISTIDNRIKVINSPLYEQYGREVFYESMFDKLDEYKFIMLQESDGISYKYRLELSIYELFKYNVDFITTGGIYKYKNGKSKYCTINKINGVGSTMSFFGKVEAYKTKWRLHFSRGCDDVWFYDMLKGFKHQFIDFPLWKHYDFTSNDHTIIKKIPVVRKIARIYHHAILRKYFPDKTWKEVIWYK